MNHVLSLSAASLCKSVKARCVSASSKSSCTNLGAVVGSGITSGPSGSSSCASPLPHSGSKGSRDDAIHRINNFGLRFLASHGVSTSKSEVDELIHKSRALMNWLVHKSRATKPMVVQICPMLSTPSNESITVQKRRLDHLQGVIRAKQKPNFIGKMHSRTKFTTGKIAVCCMLYATEDTKVLFQFP